MEDSILVTYRIAFHGALAAAAEEIASLETTGHWQGRGESTALFRRCQGWVVDVREEGPGEGEVDVALPTVNLSNNSPFTDLYMAIASGAFPALLEFDKAQIVDIQLPAAFLDQFPGPGWGADRLIARFRETNPGPLMVGTIVKPVAGLTPVEVASDCAVAAAARVVWIKDDQKMLNPAYCPLIPKVAAVVRALSDVEQQTGRRRPLYAPQVTARADRVLDEARRAIDAGAEAVMLNFMASGFNALEILAEAQLGVPVYAHCGGKETMTRVSGQGVHPQLVALLARLCGADLIRVSAPGGDLVHSDPPTVQRCLEACTRSLPGQPALLPAVSGGLNPANLPRTLDVCGRDVLFLAGRGVAGHPNGIKGGVRAMEQAAQAWIDGIDLQVYAHDHAELRAYLGTLGTKAAGAYEDAVEETSSGRPYGSITSGVRTKPSLSEDES